MSNRVVNTAAASTTTNTVEMVAEKESDRHFARYFRSMFRWKGSIYRMIWKEFVVYMFIYIVISLVYNFALQTEQKAEFEAIANFFWKHTSNIPIILLLGFLTSTAMQRWFSLAAALPGTAKVITCLVFSIKEDPDEGRHIVQHYSRWILLSWTLTFRLICKPLHKIYPDLASLQHSGLLLSHEQILLEKHSPDYQPLAVLDWALTLLQRCHRQSRFNVPADLNRNIDALLAFKKSCGNSLKFAAKNIPFAMIQAVTITVYTYGLASMLARNFTDKHHATVFISSYIPVLNTFQYFLYYIWLKFGRLAANPFGDDEDDIDVKSLLQNHIDDAVRIQSLYCGSEAADHLVTTSLQHSSKSMIVPTEKEFTETDPILEGTRVTDP